MIGMLKTYGLFGFIRLVKALLVTRLFYRPARIIRLPFYIKNRKAIEWGTQFTTGVACRLEAYPVGQGVVLHIGQRVQINDYVHITAMREVVIGDDVLIASRVYISDSNHGEYNESGGSNPLVPPQERPYSLRNVKICDRVWLGEGVCVLPGVTIGEGTIVGANSVVTKDLPPNCIAVGAPAKPVKMFDMNSGRWNKVI